MKFTYSDVPQKSPEWFKIRLGKVTASRLGDWLSVSKAKTGPGKPLKARLDYELELLYERTFGTSFEKFVTPAMQAGIEYEDFARRQYEKISDLLAEECGCWYSDKFVASPDATVGKDGLLEIKVLGDVSFTDVLVNGVPDKHMSQIQGQLWASGRKWTDYVAINLNTRKLKIIHVLPDHEFHEWVELTLSESLVTAEFDKVGVYDFVGPLPGNVASMSMPTSPTTNGEW